MDKYVEESVSQDELTYEQQELLNLVYDEVSDLLLEQIRIVSDMDSISKRPQRISDILETQISNVNRIGTAAQMIGLHGMHQFCSYIEENFKLIQATDINLLVSLGPKILYWPDVIQTYLISPSNTDYIHLVMEYFKKKELPLNVSKQKIKEIERKFKDSKIEVDSNEHIHEATPELVSLTISDDIDFEVINSLMQELPGQTQELSNSVNELQNGQFLQQLETSERIAHTLKSAGNTVGISGIVNFTHHLEGIFSALLKEKKKPSYELHQDILNATDCLQEMTEHLQGIGPFPSQSQQVLQEILDWTSKIRLYGVDTQLNKNIVSKLPVDEKVADDTKSTPEVNLAKRNEPRNGHENVHEYIQGKETKLQPTLQVSTHLVDDLLKRSGENIISNEQIQDLALQLKNGIQRLTTNNEKVKNLAQELGSMIEIHGFSPQLDEIGGYEKFDPLEIEQFNELHTSVNQLIESADDTVEFSSEISDSAHKLEQLSLNQVRNLHDNQESVLRIRMVPVKTIVPRLKRAVRQASKLSGRPVNFEIKGQDTLIDSEYIHQLVDPVMHILRNAIDHGVESEDQRIKQGKTSDGNIQLRFKKEGNLIRVICQDDGSGLDLDVIKLKSIEKGLLKKNETMSKSRAIEIILTHGFSTKDKVSQLSGRGVGLAAAHTKINDMKGLLNIESKSEQGVKVDLVIPTTFNSVHALIVRCAESTVAISNRGVDEILFAGAGDIVADSGEYYLQYKQQKYLLFDLQYMLEKVKHNKPVKNKISLIIRDETNKKYAVMIDKIFDTRDVVTKPLSKYIPNISGLHGTTILGDGTVTAVIDIVELLNNISSQSRNKLHSENIADAKDTKHYALIVEDAISTRKSLAQFMQDLGFSVSTAKDGVEAIDQIQKQVPSVVLTDLEMPRMNGLELSDHLRANAETASTPIVMITSKSTEKNRSEAERLGVNAYVTKPYDEDELLTLINTFNISS